MTNSDFTILNISPTFNTFIKSFGCLLLLSFCMLSLGCDNQSSSASVTSRSASKQTTANTTRSYDNNDQDDNDEDLADDVDEGESLLAATSQTDSSKKRRSPMIAEQNPDNALQATLIGDYVGIWPCNFCEGTAITLNLFADGSVIKTSIYENPETPRVPLIEKGIYRQDNKMIIIVYENKNIESYQIQDNHLVMMSDDTPNADYTLSRQ